MNTDFLRVLMYRDGILTTEPYDKDKSLRVGVLAIFPEGDPLMFRLCDLLKCCVALFRENDITPSLESMSLITEIAIPEQYKAYDYILADLRHDDVSYYAMRVIDYYGTIINSITDISRFLPVF